MNAHPLKEARAEQEASDLNSRLGQIVYNAIIDRLKVPGSFHSDDLESYFPSEHRKRCRLLIGGQVGSLARPRAGKEPFIRERPDSRRKSSVPERKGAKSGVWEFTKHGRDMLVGVRAGSHLGMSGGSHQGGGAVTPAGADPGEKLTSVVHQQANGSGAASLRAPDPSPEPKQLDRDRIAGVGGDGAEHAVVTPHSGESSGVGVPVTCEPGGATPNVPFGADTGDSSETLSLDIPEAGRYQDPDQRRAA